MIIYKLTSPSGKIYIGQSKNGLDFRFNQHVNVWKRLSKRIPKDYKGNCRKLFYAFDKYDPSLWIKELICECYTKDDMNEKEIEYIALYDTYYTGYNSTKGGDGRVVDFLEDSHKENISNSKLEFYQTDEGIQWRTNLSERVSGEGNPMYGKGDQIREQNSKWYLVVDKFYNEQVVKNIYQFKKDNKGKKFKTFPDTYKSSVCKEVDFRVVHLDGYDDSLSEYDKIEIISFYKQLIKPIGKVSTWNKGKTALYTQSDKQKSASSKAKGKVWIITDPEGNEFEIFSLRKYCLENGLDTSNIQSPSGSKKYKARKK